MKMVCNKAKTCQIAKWCHDARPHEYGKDCDRSCGAKIANKCVEHVPVRPKRKPVVVWVVTLRFKTRRQARYVASALRKQSADKGDVRGPVKVALP
jgi:hypothetical protein